MTNVVAVSDNDGNKAFALTHWDFVRDKPDIALKPDLMDPTKYYTAAQVDELLSNLVPVLASPNGKKYRLTVDNDGNIKGVLDDDKPV